MNTVVLLRGHAEYDVLPQIIDELAAAFRAMGYPVTVIDLFADDVNSQYKRAMSQPTEFVFAFNGMGTGLRIGPRSLYDVWGVPYVAFMVDHPMYLPERFSPDSPTFMATCVDRSHTAFLDRLFGGRLYSRFLPHGGSRSTAAPVPMPDRPIDILVAGSYYNPEQQRAAWSQLPVEAQRFMGELAEALLAAPDTPQIDTALNLLKQRGVNPDQTLFMEILKILPTVDKYVIGLRRQHAIRILAEAGCALTLYGNHWDASPFGARPNVQLHPPADFAEILRLMTQSKLVLNMLPNFPDGSHERVFSAMLNGAVPVTTTSRYLSSEFTDGKELLFYHWNRLETLPARVTALLADPAQMETMAAAGNALATQKHTWPVRAGELIELVRNFVRRA